MTITHDELNRANNIRKEIQELESFIRIAEAVWTGKIIKRTTKYIFKSSAFGVLGSQEYTMDTEMKNKVLDVLRDRLEELEKEFVSL